MYSFRDKDSGVYLKFKTQPELLKYLFDDTDEVIYYLFDRIDYPGIWEHTSIVKSSFKVYKSDKYGDDKCIEGLFVWKG